jgi:hypothetical protein
MTWGLKQKSICVMCLADIRHFVFVRNDWVIGKLFSAHSTIGKNYIALILSRS